MKFSTALLGLTAFTASVTAQACRVFRFRVENSPFSDLNGLYLQNVDGKAGINSPTGTEISAFWDDTAPVYLYANGVDGEGADNFFLVPTSTGTGSEQLVFDDFAVSEARFEDWRIIDSVLTYTAAPDRLYAFPSSAGDGGYSIYWIPEGTFTTADGFGIDLVRECL